MAAKSVAATNTLEQFRTTFNSLSATDIGDLATLNSSIDASSLVGAINEIESEVSAFSVNTITNASDLGAAPATDDSFIIRDANQNALREMTVANLFNAPTLTSPTISGTVDANGSLVFEGATADSFETTIAITDPTADRTFTIPNVTGTAITTGNLSSITSLGVLTGTTPIVMEGNTANSFETTITLTDPTADRTITLPNATGTVVLKDTTDTLTNKTLTTPVIAEIDSGSTITLDATTDIVLDANGGDVFLKDDGTTYGSLTNTSGNLIIKSGTTTALTMSGANVTIAGDLTVSGTTTTVDSATISIQNAFVFEGATDDSFETTLTTVDPTADRTVSLPNATDTLVGKATTDTLTNKTLTSPIVSGLALSDSSIVFEGSSADSFETTVTVTDPTADRTITLPNETFLLSSGINKKTLDGNGSNTTITIDAGYNVNQMTVTINGIAQEPTEDFTISGTTLTLDAAPASGDRVVVRY